MPVPVERAVKRNHFTAFLQGFHMFEGIIFTALWYFECCEMGYLSQGQNLWNTCETLGQNAGNHVKVPKLQQGIAKDRPVFLGSREWTRHTGFHDSCIIKWERSQLNDARSHVVARWGLFWDPMALTVAYQDSLVNICWIETGSQYIAPESPGQEIPQIILTSWTKTSMEKNTHLLISSFTSCSFQVAVSYIHSDRHSSS